MNKMIQKSESAFTLVELSIVLVIIGLIVGGVLTGQNLIKAAQVRAQVSQIAGYNTATNTFREKYGGLPGDLLNGANFFSGITNQNPASPGYGNGNGLIENAPGTVGGEEAVFWYELNAAGLIPDATTAANDYSGTPNINLNVFPSGKIPGQMSIVVMAQTYKDSTNYWGLGIITGNLLGYSEAPGLTVLQASQIDGKIDDGNPGTGNVISVWNDGYVGIVGDSGNYYGTGTNCTTSATGTGAYNVAASANAIACNISIKVSF